MARRDSLLLVNHLVEFLGAYLWLRLLYKHEYPKYRNLFLLLYVLEVI